MCGCVVFECVVGCVDEGGEGVGDCVWCVVCCVYCVWCVVYCVWLVIVGVCVVYCC